MISRTMTILLIAFAQLWCSCFAFYHPLRTEAKYQSVQSTLLRSLDETNVGTLEEMKSKYERLINVVSPEAEEEAAKLKETVDKYSTYVEIKKLMSKLKSMHKNEASERRKEKQLKSFIDLYKGKLQLEEILKEKLGLQNKKGDVVVQDNLLLEFQKIDSEVADLEQKLKGVELVLPQGKSTREERFQ